MEIEKSYFTLPEILERWSMSEADLVYLAENDQLRLSIRVFRLPFEFGDHEETPEGESFYIPWEQEYFSGLLDLHAHDVFQLFRHGEVLLGYFRTPRADYARLWGAREQISVRKRDLLLRREELQRPTFSARRDPGAGRARPVRGRAARRPVAERQGDPRRGGLAQPQDVRRLQVAEELAPADRVERPRRLQHRRALSALIRRDIARLPRSTVGWTGGWEGDDHPPLSR